MVECHLKADVSVIRRQYGVPVVGESTLEDLEHFSPILDDEYGGCWTLGDCHAENIIGNRRASKAGSLTSLKLPHRCPFRGAVTATPLSASPASVSFRAMSEPSAPRISTGIRVGMVAAAATIGAVIGLGLRHGLALRPFISTGRGLAGALRLDVAGDLVTAVIGLVFVALAIIVLGVCFTLVAAPLRGIELFLTAVAFGAIGWAVSVHVVPSVLVLASGAVLGTAQRVFVCGMLAIALVVGMRLARPDLDTRDTRIE